MPKFIDYSNLKIGRVKVISLFDIKKRQWNCLCDCGKEFITYSVSFKRGECFECWDCTQERKRGPDLTGRVYGRWTVIERRLDKNNKTVWFCKCDCGNTGLIPTYSLGKKHKSFSCGCWGRKMKSKWSNPSLYPKASGLSKTKFYSVRISIIHKCYQPEWPTYSLFGAKGITVCDLWRNSAKDMYDWFVSQGWKERDVILLKEGKKEFAPGNVYIINNDDFRSEIAKRNGQKITYQGECHSISEWAEKMGTNITTLRKKLISYPSVDEAFESSFRRHIFHNKPEKVKEMIEMYNKIQNVSKVAKYYKVTSSCLSYHLHKNGIEITKNVPKNDFVKDQEIFELHEKGFSLNAIAEKLGVSWPLVKGRINKKLGIKRDRSNG